MNGDSLLTVVFYRTRIGREPVRDWLKSLEPEDRKIIGEDIKLVQYRWPLGMPLVRKLEPDLWEVRIQLSGSRIVRICFTVRQHQMALLHGFIKKSQKTPENDLNLARSRRDQWLEGWQSDE